MVKFPCLDYTFAFTLYRTTRLKNIYPKSRFMNPPTAPQGQSKALFFSEDFVLVRHGQDTIEDDEVFIVPCSIQFMKEITVPELISMADAKPIVVFHTKVLRAQKSAVEMVTKFTEDGVPVENARALDWLYNMKGKDDIGAGPGLINTHIQELLEAYKGKFLIFITHQMDIQWYGKVADSKSITNWSVWGMDILIPGHKPFASI